VESSALANVNINERGQTPDPSGRSWMSLLPEPPRPAPVRQLSHCV